MPPSTTYDSLDREERLRRVGVLFSKAATLILARQQLADDIQQDVASEALTMAGKANDWPDWQMQLFRRFVPLGEFTPKDALGLWMTSRTSSYRRLQQLMKDGLIIPKGQTRSLHYHFTSLGLSLFRAQPRVMGSSGQRMTYPLDSTQPLYEPLSMISISVPVCGLVAAV